MATIIKNSSMLKTFTFRLTYSLFIPFVYQIVFISLFTNKRNIGLYHRSMPMLQYLMKKINK